MYNRYIPQDDGTFRRCSVPEPSRPKPPCPPPQEPAPCPSPEPPCDPPPPCPPSTPPCNQNTSAEGFLHNLLPRGLDTGDLLVIALLLLMAGDNQHNKNYALLTLMIYLFL